MISCPPSEIKLDGVAQTFTEGEDGDPNIIDVEPTYEYQFGSSVSIILGQLERTPDCGYTLQSITVSTDESSEVSLDVSTREMQFSTTDSTVRDISGEATYTLSNPYGEEESYFFNFIINVTCTLTEAYFDPSLDAGDPSLVIYAIENQIPITLYQNPACDLSITSITFQNNEFATLG